MDIKIEAFRLLFSNSFAYFIMFYRTKKVIIFLLFLNKPPSTCVFPRWERCKGAFDYDVNKKFVWVFSSENKFRMLPHV